MNFGIDKLIDQKVMDFEEARENNDTEYAGHVATSLVQLLLQISNNPSDGVEAYFGEKRTIKSVFGIEDRQERAEQDNGNNSTA